MENYTLEQHYVAAEFQKGMAQYQQEPLLLYGFGRNTEGVLHLTTGYSIAGLLGPSRTMGTLYGKPILSLHEAAKLSKKIVVIAPETAKLIIFRRIKDTAEKLGMEIYSFRGERIKESEYVYSQAGLDYWDQSWSGLKREVESHDVISFDIFDTLLGRYVLRPKDIFMLMENRIRTCERREIPFFEIRRTAEQNCAYGATIYDIYEKMREGGIAAEDCDHWRCEELELEKRLTYPKTKVVEIFRYALSLGKKVFLTSDMYLPKNEMEKILASHGIAGYTGLLVSCEEKAQKSDGTLYVKLSSMNPGKTILHIGDNRVADVDMALRMGIDAYHLWSGYNLLKVSSLSGLLDKPVPALGDRLSLGLLCAKLFDDPFALNETRGRVTLRTPEQMGYCFVGFWVLGFMQWASERVMEFKIEQFIYPSRDGFLFYRAAQIMREYGYMENVEHIYLKASRRALSITSIYSEQDIKAVFRERYRGTYGNMLRETFGISPDEDDAQQHMQAGSIEESLQYLCRYQSQIVAEAAQERKNYLLYLKSKNLVNQKRAATFDFVAGGTVQYHLERCLGKRLVGLYCGTLNHPNDLFPESGHILPAFGNNRKYDTQRTLFKVFPMMECLLVDGDDALEYIDESGKPVFRESKCSYEQILAVQRYACAAIDHFLSLFGRQQITLEGAEAILGAMFRRSCVVETPIVDVFSIHDEAIAGESSYYPID